MGRLVVMTKQPTLTVKEKLTTTALELAVAILDRFEATEQRKRRTVCSATFRIAATAQAIVRNRAA